MSNCGAYPCFIRLGCRHQWRQRWRRARQPCWPPSAAPRSSSAGACLGRLTVCMNRLPTQSCGTMAPWQPRRQQPWAMAAAATSGHGAGAARPRACLAGQQWRHSERSHIKCDRLPWQPWPTWGRGVENWVAGTRESRETSCDFLIQFPASYAAIELDAASKFTLVQDIETPHQPNAETRIQRRCPPSLRAVGPVAERGVSLAPLLHGAVCSRRVAMEWSQPSRQGATPSRAGSLCGQCLCPAPPPPFHPRQPRQPPSPCQLP